MQTFQGTKVNEWKIEIGFPEINDIREETGADLLQFGTPEFNDEVFGNKLQAVALTSNFLWIVCREQAEASKDALCTSPDHKLERQFLRDIQCDFENASKAFYEELAFFFQTIGSRNLADTTREALRVVWSEKENEERKYSEMIKTGKVANIMTAAIKSEYGLKELPPEQESSTTP